MRRKTIEAHIRQLSLSLGGIRPPIGPKESSELRALHEQKDFAGMVRHIKNALRLNLRMRICLVDKGGPSQAPAWVCCPSPMPPYGTRAFTQTLVTVYIRKSFLSKSPFEAVVLVMAHELSHVVLAAIDYSLVRQEEDVDLAAMLLGYRNFFRAGCKYRETIEPVGGRPFLQRMVDGTRDYLARKPVAPHIICQLGYLKFDEINFASGIMDRMADSTNPLKGPV